MPEQMTLGVANSDYTPSVVYVASPISSLIAGLREQIVTDCALIKVSAEAAADLGVPPWSLQARVPCLETSPWEAPDTAPEDIFDNNLRLLAREADALIIHAGWGGSVGAGQEFGWATSLRLPTLFLNRRGQPVSRQIRGTPADIEIVDFDSGLEVIDAVVSFIQRRRHAIQSHTHQRTDRAVSVSSLLDEVRRRWEGLTGDEQRRVAANARLHPRRIHLMLEDPSLLRASSLDEVVALTGALGIDLGQHMTGQVPEQLTNEQLQALRTAAEEYEWDAGTALRLLRDAQLELAKGGIRRLPLSSPDDWLRFKRS